MITTVTLTSSTSEPIEGDSVGLTAKLTNSGLRDFTCRWYKDGECVFEGGLVYTFTFSDTSYGTYTCIVTIEGAEVEGSYNFVVSNPVIITQPSAVSGYWEEVGAMSVSATGGQLEYQWQKSSDNITFTDIEDATSVNLDFSSLSPSDDGYYRCVVSNGARTVVSDSATATCVVHQFSELYDNDHHNMGFYDRYDQRTNYILQSNGFYIGYADNETPYHKDGVFAWAKGVTIYGSTGYHGYGYYYVGAYGASNCNLVLENSTVYLGGFYINAFDGEGDARPNNNSVVIKNSVILHNIGETLVGACGVMTAGSLTGSLTLQDGSVWKNGYNHIVVGGYERSGAYAKDCKFIVTGTGTQFLGDYGNTGNRYNVPIMVYSNAVSTGNSIDLLNSALIRVGCGQDGEQAHKAIDTYQVNNTTTSTQFAFRFGGGYLAYYGDCRTVQEYAMHWSLTDIYPDQQILPAGIVQVRNSDGTWRAGVAGDFTVTYCATDAEGLAATNNLYDGLAGYTVITAGNSI